MGNAIISYSSALLYKWHNAKYDDVVVTANSMCYLNTKPFI